ncbi:hypothetical protein GCM10009789_65750 [Kribbella sancticallisti]|uniref:Uncharacterized protein n=1 Tax=Kribbella sancticallisti TaxID=460087 RepID=A0ABN2EC88_9ACTN
MTGYVSMIGEAISVHETWATRELPVLEAVIRAREARWDQFPDGADIASATGLGLDDVGRAFLALKNEYIDLRMTGGGPGHWFVQDVTPEARRIVGQWPSPDGLVDRLITALNVAADKEADSERRSKLRTVAGLIAGTAREIFVDVAAATITGRTGITGHGPGPDGG